MPSGSLLQEPDSDGAKSGCGELISKDGYKTTPYKINDRPQGPIFPRSKRFNTGNLLTNSKELAEYPGYIDVGDQMCW